MISIPNAYLGTRCVVRLHPYTAHATITLRTGEKDCYLYEEVGRANFIDPLLNLGS